MTDKEIIDKIVAEIKRLKAQWRICKSSEAKYRLEMLDDISDIIDSMQKEPVSDDLEEEIDRAHKIFYDEVGWDSDEGARAYVADWFAHYFANWQKHHMEVNRIKHCNGISKVQAELEQKFLDEHLDKNDRMPTFLDAIEYGMVKEKENIGESPYLCGYVARDENGYLHLFEVEPRRIEHRWWDRYYYSTTLDNNAFPDLEWEDEPIYVRLLIVKSEV